MGRIYATDGKIISDGFPQIQVGDKLYAVDTRKKTYDDVQKAIKDAEAAGKEAGSEEIIIKYCLGDKALKEINAMDLTVVGYKNLLTYIQAAMHDIEFAEAEARFHRAQK